MSFLPQLHQINVRAILAWLGSSKNCRLDHPWEEAKSALSKNLGKSRLNCQWKILSQMAIQLSYRISQFQNNSHWWRNTDIYVDRKVKNFLGLKSKQIWTVKSIPHLLHRIFKMYKRKKILTRMNRCDCWGPGDC